MKRHILLIFMQTRGVVQFVCVCLLLGVAERVERELGLKSKIEILSIKFVVSWHTLRKVFFSNGVVVDWSGYFFRAS